MTSFPDDIEITFPGGGSTSEAVNLGKYKLWQLAIPADFAGSALVVESVLAVGETKAENTYAPLYDDQDNLVALAVNAKPEVIGLDFFAGAFGSSRTVRFESTDNEPTAVLVLRGK